ncbi:MAG: hypothetical protein RL316_24, partial [Bacteroidota bacterium]
MLQKKLFYISSMGSKTRLNLSTYFVLAVMLIMGIPFACNKEKGPDPCANTSYDIQTVKTAA